MFRTIGDPVSLWESRLPAEVLRLPEELAQVDALLDDPAFFAPFAPFFHSVVGRPSTPAECCLRLMFLKFRYRLGYESLCAEVSDSISWRRFCRIPLDGKVPHPTTLMKLTTQCADGARPGWSACTIPMPRRSARGHIDRPVEFGYKAQVADNDDGVILDYRVEYSAAPDGPQLTPAVERASRRAGRVPGRSPPATASPPSNGTSKPSASPPSRYPGPKGGSGVLTVRRTGILTVPLSVWLLTCHFRMPARCLRHRRCRQVLR
jgi:hypothetical protein